MARAKACLSRCSHPGRSHAFPGASLPYGMAKASADCIGEAHGGFSSDGSDVSGFSHMHDSGTGGTISLGNFPLFPQYCPNNNMTECKFDKTQRRVPRGDYDASPGYFDITLADGIRGEATVTAHTAIYRFTFPENITFGGTADNPVVTIDLNDLGGTRTGESGLVVDPQTGRVYGNGTFRPSFGTGTYNLHFCTDFRGGQIQDTGIWNASGPFSGDENLSFNGYNPGGAFTRFEPSNTDTTILVRVGLSFISSNQACRNAESEIPEFEFDWVRRAAEAEWQKKFSVVTIDSEGVDTDLTTIFWSGFYRTMLSPQDYTNENPLWTSREPYFDSFYCIWDSFRSQHPFLTLVDPVEQARMVRALIDIYKHEGKLPDCRMSLCKGRTQGGSNADVVLADAYVKNLGGGINWHLAYEAVISDAEEEPKMWDFTGRGGLDSWKTLNFIPVNDVDTKGYGLQTRSISRTVEFAYNDFCIAEMAERLGHMDDREKYLSRAGNWRNLFKEDQNSSINDVDTGFRGFLQPRYADLTWDFQDPARCSPLYMMDSCYLDGGGGETYEGSCWLYTFFVPHDMASLVDALGGPSRFTERLDFLHHSGLLYMGDEQAFLTVFLYHYAGRPAISAERAHFYIPSQFNNTDAGIPGNDDSGAMGSFITLTMMGIFPNPGQDVYFITPPFFESVSIVNEQTGKTATIKNINFDPEYKNVYIQEATRDGKPWTKNWIDHSFFAEGGILELTLGLLESDWGTREEDLPPSMSAIRM
ncbi:glycoside hydrolase family 92 protein [Oidiodendron maius Zn]|uniref:Glycoside hydrolase family 92 protein n=1 Tax=Oidiodendron maius (strain Zn) TaxID=913774 RepID=A0A0C3D2U3_OIDMZ|nr:glycoside hydrolase family 92 protein [Oidiodendron maius Zn]